MIDDEEFTEQEIEISEFPLDPVAARCEAFTKLLMLASQLKDEELRKEGMMMLGAVRRSFRTLPTGELTSMPGGKQ